MIAERRSFREIAELLTEQGIEFTRQGVARYMQTKKWGRLIQRMRRVFETELTRIPIANKAFRLKLLQKVAFEGLIWNLKSVCPKTMKGIYEMKIAATVQAVREAREEMKGSDVFVDPLADEEIGPLFDQVKDPAKKFARFLN